LDTDSLREMLILARDSSKQDAVFAAAILEFVEEVASAAPPSLFAAGEGGDTSPEQYYFSEMLERCRLGAEGLIEEALRQRRELRDAVERGLAHRQLEDRP